MRYKNENKANYQTIRDYVKKLRIPRNTNYRGGCPLCGGINTLSVSNTDGKLRWYCFKASCHVKGTNSTEPSLFDAKDFLDAEEPKTKEPLAIQDCAGWQTDVQQHERPWKYLQDNNCQIAFEAYPDKFFYDVPNQRMVFCEKLGTNALALATGRSLVGRVPKWYKYVALPGTYFTLLNNANATTIFITEDCASAASLYRLGSSLALCGTAWNLYALVQVIVKLGAKNIMVCLDKDARLLALRLRTELRSIGDFTNVGLGLLSDDAKYLAIDQLKKELNYG